MKRRKRALDDRDRDIQEHIERETSGNLGRGMPPDEARVAVLRKCGNVTRVKEATREVWRLCLARPVAPRLALLFPSGRRSDRNAAIAENGTCVWRGAKRFAPRSEHCQH